MSRKSGAGGKLKVHSFAMLCLAKKTVEQQLQSLEDVVSRELGAPYTVQHLPDTGQTMLTPMTGGGAGAGRGC